MQTTKKLQPARPVLTPADVDALGQSLMSATAIVRAAIVALDPDDADTHEAQNLLRGAVDVLNAVDVAWFRKAIEVAQ